MPPPCAYNDFSSNDTHDQRQPDRQRRFPIHLDSEGEPLHWHRAGPLVQDSHRCVSVQVF